MANTRPKTFTCWEAGFSTGPAYPTLQRLLGLAFDGTKYSDRLSPAQVANDRDDDDLPYQSLINECFAKGNFRLGHFLKFNREQHASAIKQSLDGSSLDITQFKVPNADDGQPQHLLYGNLYFVCHENYLIVSHDQYLKPIHLESYLNEMLHKYCPGFVKGKQLNLNRTISRKKHHQLRGVRKLKISGSLYRKTNDETIKESPTIPPSQFQAIASAVTGQEIDRYDQGIIAGSQNIDFSMVVSWKRNRGDTISTEMDAIANTFRHIDGEINIEFITNLGRIKRDQLTLSLTENVVFHENMPSSTDIYEKMMKWMLELVNSHEI